ncbi:hypothetical protein ABIB50_002782 [Mucilaginibacter sp. UYCu711]
MGTTNKYLWVDRIATIGKYKAVTGTRGFSLICKFTLGTFAPLRGMHPWQAQLCSLEKLILWVLFGVPLGTLYLLANDLKIMDVMNINWGQPMNAHLA